MCRQCTTTGIETSDACSAKFLLARTFTHKVVLPAVCLCFVLIAENNVVVVFECNYCNSHPDLEESLLRYFRDNTTPSHLKMADTPGDDTTRLIPVMADNGAVSPFPLVAVRNVFILPGEGLVVMHIMML